MSRNASDSESELAKSRPSTATKFCHIVKRPDFEGYGFNLHSEKIKPGQYIGKVDPDSPAEAAGLKEGDRIVEVNGVPIENETHKQVVQRIKSISSEVRLVVVDVQSQGDLFNQVGTISAPTIINSNSSNNSNGNIGYEGTVQELPGASANISSITVRSTKRTSQTINSASNVDIDETDKATSGNSKLNSMTQKNGNDSTPTSLIMPSPSSHTSDTGYANKSGGLQLPMTAAEMRAKLLSKKKYDPKNESVDLKKKFDIIQKL